MRAAMFVLSLLISLTVSGLISLTASGQQVTSGPILSRWGRQGVSIWLRMDRPEAFQTRCGSDRRHPSFSRALEQTQLARDNTGWVHLQGLPANRRYFNGVATNKDDAWPGFMDQREQPIRDKLAKSVWVLPGDLHSSFAIKIADRVWGFVSGPHNSNNHWYSDEAARPANGPFQFGLRARDIRCSRVFLNDIPRQNLQHPTYCVV